MKTSRYLVGAILFGFLTGCGGDNESGNNDEAPQGVISEQQLKALEKAKSVEQMLLDSEEKRKRAMKENQK